VRNFFENLFAPIVLGIWLGILILAILDYARPPQNNRSPQATDANGDHRHANDLAVLVGEYATYCASYPNDEKDEWFRKTVCDVKVTDVALAAFTAALAAATITLIAVGLGQGHQLKRSVDAIQGTERRQLRAYVGVEEISFVLPHLDHLGWMAPDPPPDGYIYDDFILVKVRNFGATPAYELRVGINWVPIIPFSIVLPPNAELPDHVGVIPPSTSQVLDAGRPFPATINVNDMLAFQQAVARVASLYIHGYIGYTDVYGRRWHRKFRYVWEPYRSEGPRFTPDFHGNNESYEGERQPKMPA